MRALKGARNEDCFPRIRKKRQPIEQKGILKILLDRRDFGTDCDGTLSGVWRGDIKRSPTQHVDNRVQAPTTLKSEAEGLYGVRQETSSA